MSLGEDVTATADRTSGASVAQQGTGQIAGWRAHPGSGFVQRMDECHRIYDQIVEMELDHTDYGKLLKLFRRAREKNSSEVGNAATDIRPRQ